MSSKERMKAAFSGMAYPTYEGREAANRQREKSKSELCIWLCGAPVDLEALSLLIKPFVQSGGKVHVCLSDASKAIINYSWVCKCLKGAVCYSDPSVQTLQSILSACGCLLIPNLSQNMAAKLALGIQDQKSVVFAWAALGMNVKVEAVSCSVTQPSYFGLDFEATPGQNALMKSYLEQVEKLGIRVHQNLTELKNLWQVEGKYSLNGLSNGKFQGESYAQLKDALGLKVVTERHILALEKGSRLKIERGAKVTPLAKDAAKQRQIELIRKE